MIAHNLILITDPNSDPDDLVSFIVLTDLVRLGQIKLSAAVTTAGKAEVRQKRANFALGAFRFLGCNVPVAAGDDYELKDPSHENNFWCGEAADALIHLSGKCEKNALDLMVKVLEKSENKSVTLLLNAPMIDAGNLIENCDALVSAKILQIVVMGGINIEPDAQGLYAPNALSYNNKVCFDATQKIFEFAQKQNIRLVLVPKETVYQAQIERNFYDEMENNSNLVAQCLWRANRHFIEFLWKTVKSGNYSHFDVKRFAKVFMGKDFRVSNRVVTAKSSFEEIWKKIKFFNLYDAISALAVVESEFEKFGYYEQLGETNIFIAKISDADMLRNKLYKIVMEKLRS